MGAKPRRLDVALMTLLACFLLNASHAVQASMDLATALDDPFPHLTIMEGDGARHWRDIVNETPAAPASVSLGAAAGSDTPAAQASRDQAPDSQRAERELAAPGGGGGSCGPHGVCCAPGHRVTTSSGGVPTSCGPCPQGYTCAGGTNPPQPCASYTQYCPAGSTTASSVNVAGGYYSWPEWDNANGIYPHEQRICPAGSFCCGGRRYDCPAGWYQPSTGQDRCLQGYKPTRPMGCVQNGECVNAETGACYVMCNKCVIPYTDSNGANYDLVMNDGQSLLEAKSNAGVPSADWGINEGCQLCIGAGGSSHTGVCAGTPASITIPPGSTGGSWCGSSNVAHTYSSGGHAVSRRLGESESSSESSSGSSASEAFLEYGVALVQDPAERRLVPPATPPNPTCGGPAEPGTVTAAPTSPGVACWDFDRTTANDTCSAGSGSDFPFCVGTSLNCEWCDVPNHYECEVEYPVPRTYYAPDDMVKCGCAFPNDPVTGAAGWFQFEYGELNPNSTCQICESSSISDYRTWTNIQDGTTGCKDDPCYKNNRCQAGTCVWDSYTTCSPGTCQVWRPEAQNATAPKCDALGECLIETLAPGTECAPRLDDCTPQALCLGGEECPPYTRHTPVLQNLGQDVVLQATPASNLASLTPDSPASAFPATVLASNGHMYQRGDMLVGLQGRGWAATCGPLSMASALAVVAAPGSLTWQAPSCSSFFLTHGLDNPSAAQLSVWEATNTVVRGDLQIRHDPQDLLAQYDMSVDFAGGVPGDGSLIMGGMYVAPNLSVAVPVLTPASCSDVAMVDSTPPDGADATLHVVPTTNAVLAAASSTDFVYDVTTQPVIENVYCGPHVGIQLQGFVELTGDGLDSFWWTIEVMRGCTEEGPGPACSNTTALEWTAISTAGHGGFLVAEWGNLAMLPTDGDWISIRATASNHLFMFADSLERSFLYDCSGPEIIPLAFKPFDRRSLVALEDWEQLAALPSVLAQADGAHVLASWAEPLAGHLPLELAFGTRDAPERFVRWHQLNSTLSRHVPLGWTISLPPHDVLAQGSTYRLSLRQIDFAGTTTVSFADLSIDNTPPEVANPGAGLSACVPLWPAETRQRLRDTPFQSLDGAWTVSDDAAATTSSTLEVGAAFVGVSDLDGPGLLQYRFKLHMSAPGGPQDIQPLPSNDGPSAGTNATLAGVVAGQVANVTMGSLEHLFGKFPNLSPADVVAVQGSVLAQHPQQYVLECTATNVAGLSVSAMSLPFSIVTERPNITSFNVAGTPWTDHAYTSNSFSAPVAWAGVLPNAGLHSWRVKVYAAHDPSISNTFSAIAPSNGLVMTSLFLNALPRVIVSLTAVGGNGLTTTLTQTEGLAYDATPCTGLSAATIRHGPVLGTPASLLSASEPFYLQVGQVVDAESGPCTCTWSIAQTSNLGIVPAARDFSGDVGEAVQLLTMPGALPYAWASISSSASPAVTYTSRVTCVNGAGLTASADSAAAGITTHMPVVGAVADLGVRAGGTAAQPGISSSLSQGPSDVALLQNAEADWQGSHQSVSAAYGNAVGSGGAAITSVQAALFTTPALPATLTGEGPVQGQHVCVPLYSSPTELQQQTPFADVAAVVGVSGVVDLPIPAAVQNDAVAMVVGFKVADANGLVGFAYTDGIIATNRRHSNAKVLLRHVEDWTPAAPYSKPVAPGSLALTWSGFDHDHAMPITQYEVIVWCATDFDAVQEWMGDGSDLSNMPHSVLPVYTATLSTVHQVRLPPSADLRSAFPDTPCMDFDTDTTQSDEGLPFNNRGRLGATVEAYGASGILSSESTALLSLVNHSPCSVVIDAVTQVTQTSIAVSVTAADASSDIVDVQLLVGSSQHGSQYMPVTSMGVSAKRSTEPIRWDFGSIVLATELPESGDLHVTAFCSNAAGLRGSTTELRAIVNMVKPLVPEPPALVWTPAEDACTAATARSIVDGATAGTASQSLRAVHAVQDAASQMTAGAGACIWQQAGDIVNSARKTSIGLWARVSDASGAWVHASPIIPPVRVLSDASPRTLPGSAGGARVVGFHPDTGRSVWCVSTSSLLATATQDAALPAGTADLTDAVQHYISLAVAAGDLLSVRDAGVVEIGCHIEAENPSGMKRSVAALRDQVSSLPPLRIAGAAPPVPPVLVEGDATWINSAAHPALADLLVAMDLDGSKPAVDADAPLPIAAFFVPPQGAPLWARVLPAVAGQHPVPLADIIVEAHLVHLQGRSRRGRQSSVSVVLPASVRSIPLTPAALKFSDTTLRAAAAENTTVPAQGDSGAQRLTEGLAALLAVPGHAVHVTLQYRDALGAVSPADVAGASIVLIPAPTSELIVSPPILSTTSAPSASVVHVSTIEYRALFPDHAPLTSPVDAAVPMATRNDGKAAHVVVPATTHDMGADELAALGNGTFALPQSQLSRASTRAVLFAPVWALPLTVTLPAVRMAGVHVAGVGVAEVHVMVGSTPGASDVLKPVRLFSASAQEGKLQNQEALLPAGLASCKEGHPPQAAWHMRRTGAASDAVEATLPLTWTLQAKDVTLEPGKVYYISVSAASTTGASQHVSAVPLVVDAMPSLPLPRHSAADALFPDAALVPVTSTLPVAQLVAAGLVPPENAPGVPSIPVTFFRPSNVAVAPHMPVGVERVPAAAGLDNPSSLATQALPSAVSTAVRRDVHRAPLPLPDKESTEPVRPKPGMQQAAQELACSWIPASRPVSYAVGWITTPPGSPTLVNPDLSSLVTALNTGSAEWLARLTRLLPQAGLGTVAHLSQDVDEVFQRVLPRQFGQDGGADITVDGGRIHVLSVPYGSDIAAAAADPVADTRSESAAFTLSAAQAAVGADEAILRGALPSQLLRDVRSRAGAFPSPLLGAVLRLQAAVPAGTTAHCVVHATSLGGEPTLMVSPGVLVDDSQPTVHPAAMRTDIVPTRINGTDLEQGNLDVETAGFMPDLVGFDGAKPGEVAVADAERVAVEYQATAPAFVSPAAMQHGVPLTFPAMHDAQTGLVEVEVAASSSAPGHVGGFGAFGHADVAPWTPVHRSTTGQPLIPNMVAASDPSKDHTVTVLMALQPALAALREGKQVYLGVRFTNGAGGTTQLWTSEPVAMDLTPPIVAGLHVDSTLLLSRSSRADGIAAFLRCAPVASQAAASAAKLARAGLRDLAREGDSNVTSFIKELAEHDSKAPESSVDTLPVGVREQDVAAAAVIYAQHVANGTTPPLFIGLDTASVTVSPCSATDELSGIASYEVGVHSSPLSQQDMAGALGWLLPPTDLGETDQIILGVDRDPPAGGNPGALAALDTASLPHGAQAFVHVKVFNGAGSSTLLPILPLVLDTKPPTLPAMCLSTVLLDDDGVDAVADAASFCSPARAAELTALPLTPLSGVLAHWSGAVTDEGCGVAGASVTFSAALPGGGVLEHAVDLTPQLDRHAGDVAASLKAVLGAGKRADSLGAVNGTAGIAALWAQAASMPLFDALPQGTRLSVTMKAFDCAGNTATHVGQAGVVDTAAPEIGTAQLAAGVQIAGGAAGVLAGGRAAMSVAVSDAASWLASASACVCADALVRAERQGGRSVAASSPRWVWPTQCTCDPSTLGPDHALGAFDLVDTPSVSHGGVSASAGRWTHPAQSHKPPALAGTTHLAFEVAPALLDSLVQRTRDSALRVMAEQSGLALGLLPEDVHIALRFGIEVQDAAGHSSLAYTPPLPLLEGSMSTSQVPLPVSSAPPLPQASQEVSPTQATCAGLAASDPSALAAAASQLPVWLPHSALPSLGVCVGPAHFALDEEQVELWTAALTKLPLQQSPRSGMVDLPTTSVTVDPSFESSLSTPAAFASSLWLTPTAGDAAAALGTGVLNISSSVQSALSGGAAVHHVPVSGFAPEPSVGVPYFVCMTWTHLASGSTALSCSTRQVLLTPAARTDVAAWAAPLSAATASGLPAAFSPPGPQSCRALHEGVRQHNAHQEALEAAFVDAVPASGLLAAMAARVVAAQPRGAVAALTAASGIKPATSTSFLLRVPRAAALHQAAGPVSVVSVACLLVGGGAGGSAAWAPAQWATVNSEATSRLASSGAPLPWWASASAAPAERCQGQLPNATVQSSGVWMQCAASGAIDIASDGSATNLATPTPTSSYSLVLALGLATGEVVTTVPAGSETLLLQSYSATVKARSVGARGGRAPAFLTAQGDSMGLFVAGAAMPPPARLRLPLSAMYHTDVPVVHAQLASRDTPREQVASILAGQVMPVSPAQAAAASLLSGTLPQAGSAMKAPAAPCVWADVERVGGSGTGSTLALRGTLLLAWEAQPAPPPTCPIMYTVQVGTAPGASDVLPPTAVGTLANLAVHGVSGGVDAAATAAAEAATASSQELSATPLVSQHLYASIQGVDCTGAALPASQAPPVRLVGAQQDARPFNAARAAADPVLTVPHCPAILHTQPAD